LARHINGHAFEKVAAGFAKSNRGGWNAPGRLFSAALLGGKIILQVQEDAPVWWSWRGATRRRYRDANSMDLARPELAALLSLRVDPTGLRRDRLVPYVSGRPPAGSDREPISAGALTAAAAAR
jgi:hypothetical protein